jgi:nicotinamidase-related amidase
MQDTIWLQERAPDVDDWANLGTISHRTGQGAPGAHTRSAGRFWQSAGITADRLISLGFRRSKGEVVLRKTTPSAFNGTPLVHHLVSLHIDTLIVAGESTSGCVRASVVDGCSYRFRMIVAEDCVFDRHQATHAINLFDMHTKYADVLSLAEIQGHLRSAALGSAGNGVAPFPVGVLAS